jgi:hypothetical protein
MGRRLIEVDSPPKVIPMRGQFNASRALMCCAVMACWRLGALHDASAAEPVGQPSHGAASLAIVHDFSPQATHPNSPLRHALALMADSKAARRRTVRVLFYGQSITEQDWWKSVADSLRHNFPAANLVIENRAIGGFSTQLLVRTAETDVYPFYPDLVILHAYGSHLDYETLVRNIRTRTTADILLQNDHLSAHDSIDEPTDPAVLTPQEWTPWMNAVFLPSLARKYDLTLIDQREIWKRYLREHDLEPSALLRDESHLNDRGNELMANIVSSYLQPANEPGPPDDRVRDLRVGEDVHWKDGALALDFDGNRVDIVCSAPFQREIAVTIDGKPPSQHAELYALTRTTPFPETTWPCLLQVKASAPRIAEAWTLTLSDVTDDMSAFRFRVEGSKTGPDGEGQRDRRFVSRSGRVVIEPEDWNLDYARRVFQRSVRDGFQIQWAVEPQGVDVVTCPAQTGPASAGPALEMTVTIAQGLSPGKHRLELRGGEQAAIEAIRIYRPPTFPE